MISGRLRFVAASALALSSMFGLSVGVVSAHAQYASSIPSANATVAVAPSSVQITYTQELSDIQITVTGPDGSTVSTGLAKFDLAQRHNASVPTRDAGPGVYTVVWSNVSGEDGDSNDGAFVFTVAGATPGPPATTPAAPAAAATSGQSSAPGATTPAAAPTCIDNGVRTPGINDVRVDTYCKRQAIRDKYAGQIDVSSFNDDLAAGKGFASALADAMADFQMEQAAKMKH
jgi:methionine-rich copper-binding protein CopC